MDKPLSLSKARVAKVRGRVNKNLPPTANKIAKNINPKIIKILSPLDIFFEERLLMNLNRK